VIKAIDASKVPGSSFFCHFLPKNYPHTKHTKTYSKVRAFFVKTSTCGSYLNDIHNQHATMNVVINNDTYKCGRPDSFFSKSGIVNGGNTPSRK
jgi:hypothetical protein